MELAFSLSALRRGESGEAHLILWMEREHYYGQLEMYINVYLGLGINVANFGGI